MHAQDRGGTVAVSLRGRGLSQGVVHGVSGGRGVVHRRILSHHSSGKLILPLFLSCKCRLREGVVNGVSGGHGNIYFLSQTLSLPSRPWAQPGSCSWSVWRAGSCPPWHPISSFFRQAFTPSLANEGFAKELFRGQEIKLAALPFAK